MFCSHCLNLKNKKISLQKLKESKINKPLDNKSLETIKNLELEESNNDLLEEFEDNDENEDLEDNIEELNEQKSDVKVIILRCQSVF